MKKHYLLLLPILCTPLTVNADIITVNYTGSVTDLGILLSGDSVSLGDTVNGSFSYDTSLAAGDSLLSFNLSINAFSAQLDGSYTFTNVGNDRPEDSFVLGGNGTNTGLNGHTSGLMQFGVRRVDGSLWGDTLLPDLADWANITVADMNSADWRWIDFGLVTDNFRDDQLRWDVSGFSVTSTVVPLPAAAWLFGSGLIGLVGIARYKKV